MHLLEKQKAKYIYGVLEGQFRRYMTEAFNTPGVTGMNLLRTLERRLDNVVFQLGFSDSRKQGRQIVRRRTPTSPRPRTEIGDRLGESTRPQEPCRPD